jgi:hypothetical protein
MGRAPSLSARRWADDHPVLVVALTPLGPNRLIEHDSSGSTRSRDHKGQPNTRLPSERRPTPVEEKRFTLADTKALVSPRRLLEWGRFSDGISARKWLPGGPSSTMIG